MKAMILAAGYGKRLAPLTNDLPKPLLKVGDKTLIEHNIETLSKYGVKEIVINVSYLGQQIIDFLKDKFPNLKISFLLEEKPLGTGGGIVNALSYFEKPFIVMNADIFHSIDLNNLDINTESAHLIGVQNPSHNLTGDFSIENDVVVINEINTHTWSGISIINPKIFENASLGNIYDIWRDIFPRYIKDQKITACETNDFWMDVGTIERLELANKIYKEEN